MYGEDVGLHVHVAAGVIDRSGRVKRPCYRHKGFDRAAVGLVIVSGGTPCLVQWCPSHNRGVVAVAHHDIPPFAFQVENPLRVTEGVSSAPVREFAPRQITQPVGPIVKTLLKDLLVQAGTVKAGCHRHFDIRLQRRVAGSGPNAIRIKALVENKPQIDGFVVQIKAVAFNVKLSQAGVAIHRIGHLTAVGQFQPKTIKIGVTKAPGTRIFDVKNHRISTLGRATR
ncbi:hypothetical protein ES703_104804 [subsurface metagenome]